VRYVTAAHTSLEARSAEFWRRLQGAAGGGAITILAISGGGADGAFSAGALVGIDELGERPQYTVVTGVSTGALLAPFAFLGPAWDRQLASTFASGSCGQLMRFPGLGWLFRPSIYDGNALVRLVDQLFTDALIDAVAAHAAEGRQLLIATTNLDTQETVIWDLGAIAAQRSETARRLFRRVLVASASYPGLLPPTLIRVEGPGGIYDEMHIDGGTTAPFFIAPDLSEVPAEAREALRGARIYVLLNRQLQAPIKTTPEKKLPIMMRSFSANLRVMARTTIETTAAFAQHYGMDLSIASIPVDYPLQRPFDFNAEVLQHLFEYAKQCASSGQLWITSSQALDRDGLVQHSCERR
jgi:predicted acylesterase/phospholipase RssA